MLEGIFFIGSIVVVILVVGAVRTIAQSQVNADADFKIWQENERRK